MTTATADAMVNAYLNRLEEALASLPADRRR